VAGPFAAPSGFAPTQIRNEYGFNAMGSDAKGNPIDGRGQIIGIVLWDSDADLQSDMSTFLSTYSYLEPMNGLTSKTPCTVSKTIHTTPCFEVAYATGTKPPAMNPQSQAEASLDVQWAHVTAEGADILFVEAKSDSGPNLLVAVKKAVSLGATVVSMSWDQTGISAADNSDFDVSTAGFVSGSGDFGCPDNSKQIYPSGSSYVLSVGGTALTIDGSESSQTTWAKSGGYANSQESRPGYQLNWSSDPDRTDNDVAYNAVDYPIVIDGAWYTEDGVSAGIPQWAGLVADADQARAALGKSVLAASDAGKLGPGKIDKAFFTDITTGSAGSSATCKASKGWDWPTGLGTPKANGLVNELADI
jgi:subtilase family serine protease